MASFSAFSFGFKPSTGSLAPWSPASGENEMVSQMQIPVVDGHVDLVYDMMRRVPGTIFSRVRTGQVTPAGLEKGRVRVMVAALFCPDTANGPEKATACLGSLFEYVKRYLDGVDIIRSRAMLKRALEGQNTSGMLYLIENADVMAEVEVEDLKARGVVAAGLTYVGENRLGDGNGVKSPGKLKDLGKKVLGKMAETGIALDVAHLSTPCFREALDIFDGPVFSSHTGLRRFCDIPRNLTDEQLRLLVKRGAVIGVTANPEMLRKDGTAGLADMYKQLDWIIQTHGPEHAAIGSDFGGFDIACAGLEHIGKLQTLADRMFMAGYPEDAVEKVMGGNWGRFYGGILGEDDGTPFTPKHLLLQLNSKRSK